MPLSPSPLMPGHSPLPVPGERPANRGAVRLGAFFGVLTLVAALVPGQLFLTRLVFLTPSFLTRADSNLNAHASSANFQGFTYWWTRRSTGQGGFGSPASLQNMQSEVHDFHMNTVIIPIVADMPNASGSSLYWRTSDNYAKLDTLPDLDYAKAVDDARKAGLEPIFELVLRQQDDTYKPLEGSSFIGGSWYNQTSGQYLSTGQGTIQVGPVEHAWVDNYTAFAVHFAQLALIKQMRFFIIGDSLGNLTSDTPNTGPKGDPQGVVAVRGDNNTFDATKCSGRHECEWRHIIHAVRSLTYSTYVGQKAQVGANYQGKLIYAASWGPGDANPSGKGEFEAIQWWDALDAIGVDAYFPLTLDADVGLARLLDAWHGKGAGVGAQHDIYSRLENVSDQFGKVVVFTGAGYESAPGANNSPGQTSSITGSAPDQDEQLNDMQSLLMTFTGTPWWVGVVWFADQPLYPRSQQSNWTFGTQWAGDHLGGSKPGDQKAAGVWLASYTHSLPVPCLC